MDISEARDLKRRLARYAEELLAVRPSSVSGPSAGGVALGLTRRPSGEFEVAVRYPLGTPTARMVARRLVGESGRELDVRRTGRIRPVRVPGLRPPVATASAVGETGRVRPLRPGISIAHHAVSAGTLGGFVTIDGADGIHALSNFHVLAGSPDANTGDVILQPGPADGGTAEDRVGTLAAWAPVTSDAAMTVDAAVALLDEPDVEADYPSGRLTGWGAPTGTEVVEKIGRTTGVTRGRVVAIELDGIVVGYGGEVGDLRFDNQIEVEGTGVGPFSRGGDSGSLVYRPQDQRVIGLLFAGSETGGENGAGLTYLNPIDEVLTALGATLL